MAATAPEGTLLPPPPLVEGRGFEGSGARHRLRGPGKDKVKPEHAAMLEPLPTTVSEHGVIRFGDSLLLLNHSTEILLQADTSRKWKAVDDSHSAHREFEVYPVTTGAMLRPCARNSFSVVRADRNDGYGDDLEVHYEQPVRLLASALLSGELLYLHLEAPDGPPVLMPRAAGRTLWRLLPVPSEQGRGHTAKAVAGQVVRVHECVLLENVVTGRMLVSSTAAEFQETGFGLECCAFVSNTPGEIERRPETLRDGTWSFVNEIWVDAVHAAVDARTGGVKWKDDEGDDFRAGREFVKQTIDDHPALLPPEDSERARQEQLHNEMCQDPRVAACARIFQILRARRPHGVRKARVMCLNADIGRSGCLPARIFEGVFTSMVRMTPREFEDLCAVFDAKEDSPAVNYDLFFWFLAGVWPEPRLEVVRRAYRKLALMATDRSVTADDLIQHWNAKCSPEVQRGLMDEKEADADFLSQWVAVHANGHVSAEEFIEYYRDVSTTYDDSAEFVKMVIDAWDL